ncbi:MFS transporter [Amycolatopsis benzoatilytica]|uniref:MFS transporter n=1 Tax=Amycolatopsis benzoatilytica TaxID=346045 RepID=UPI000684DBC6|nr:MFS transporter [Amycolatopsis benzoatilytica]
MTAPAVPSRSTRPAATPATSARGWVVTVLLLVFMLINFADKAVLGLAAKPLMHDLGLTPESYGLISSGFYFLFSISAIVVGFVANRVPSKWILLVLGVVWALTQAPMLGSAGFGVLLVSRIVLGAAEGPANPLAMHAAYKWFPNEKRALPSSLLNAGSGLGVALAAPLLTAVIVAHGWRWAFFALLVIGLVWAVLWAVFGREGTVAGTASVHTAQKSEVDEPRVPYRRILLSGTWLGGFLSGFAAYWALAVLVAWVPHYLETALHYRPVTTGTLVALPWIASVVFNVCQGTLTDRLMRRGVSSRMARGVLGGIAVVLSGIAMLAFPHVGAGWLQIALLTIAFSLGGVVFAIGMTVNAEISPTRQRGAVLSISVGLVTTAGLIAPYLTGLLIQSASSPAVGYTLAFSIGGVLSLVGGVVSIVFVRPERTARRLGLRPVNPTGSTDGKVTH